MTDVLTPWLSAQYDEDERVALAAPRRNWTIYVAGDPETGEETEQRVLDHVIRHSPDRTLAEVEAKRRRLERHRPDQDPFHGVICAWCSVPQAGAYQSWPCPDIRDDAAVYSGSPEYRSEWRPA